MYAEVRRSGDAGPASRGGNTPGWDSGLVVLPSMTLDGRKGVGKEMISRQVGCAVTTAAVVLFTSGCGDGSGPPAVKRTAEARPAEATAMPRQPLTQARLERLTVTQGDLAGSTVTTTGAQMPDRARVADPPACQGVSAGFGQVAAARPTARVVRIVTKTGTDGATLALASYRSADARKAMADLRAGIRSCKSFTIDPMFRYENIRALPDPRKGNESLSFSIDQVSEAGTRVPTTFVVIRSGTVVLNVSAMHLARDGRPATVEPALLDTQLSKLSDAATGAP